MGSIQVWSARRVAVIAMLALAWAMLGGCSSAGGAKQLKGMRPPGPAYVGGVTMPEVEPGQPDRTFHFRAAPGHVLFVYFGYTNCPDICPTTLSDLRRALRKVGGASARVEVAFVTVDPYRDTAEVLVPYLASFTQGAHALYPRTQQQLGQAESAFGATSMVSKKPDGSFEVSHTGLAYIVDPTGHVLVQWDFGTSADVMAHDLRVLLAHPAGGPA